MFHHWLGDDRLRLVFQCMVLDSLLFYVDDDDDVEDESYAAQ